MNKCAIIVFLVQLIYASGWVFNNVDIDGMNKFENIDELNSLTPLDVENMDPKLRFSLIYPGTKWCGAGDIANNFNDLGSEWRTDMCCREHDYCPDTIPAGEKKHNLTNDAFYTRLSCSCDDTFRLCLQGVKSLAAENIGIFYFNALNTKCYRKDFPVQQCLKKGGWLNKKCLVWSYNTTATQIYQWFDVNNYR